MVDMQDETRIDVRKVVIGGLLAWIIQAMVMFFHRFS